MKLSLYDRLKPEHKQKLLEYHTDLPFSHNEIVQVLSNEYYFTEVRFGIAADVSFICKINFFGNAFDE